MYFVDGNVWISIKMSLKIVRKVSINEIPTMVQLMAWRRLGGKPLSKPMMVSLLTHICVTRPPCVNVSTFFCSQETQAKNYEVWKLSNAPKYLVCAHHSIRYENSKISFPFNFFLWHTFTFSLYVWMATIDEKFDYSGRPIRNRKSKKRDYWKRKFRV